MQREPAGRRAAAQRGLGVELPVLAHLGHRVPARDLVAVLVDLVRTGYTYAPHRGERAGYDPGRIGVAQRVLVRDGPPRRRLQVLDRRRPQPAGGRPGPGRIDPY